MTGAGDTEPAELREALEAVALAGGRWGDVLAPLAAAVGVTVRLVAADGAMLCEADADGVREFVGAEDLDGDRRRLVSETDLRRAFEQRTVVDVRCLDDLSTLGLAVWSGERRVGVILVEASATDAAARLRDAATAVAIVTMRRDAEAAAVAQTASWFVDELRFGTARAADDLTAVGRRFGVDLEAPQVAVALHYDGTDRRMFATALTWLETPVRQDGTRAFTVFPARAPERLALAARRLASMVGDGAVRIASGSSAVGGPALRTSFTRAGFTLAHARRTGRTGTVSFAELGPVGLMSELPLSDLDAYVEAYLGPLAARPELLETLQEWFRSGGSWRAIAAATHVHRNSVGHRLDRIRAMLSVDPAEPAAAFELQFALTALEVIATHRHPSD